MKMVITWNNGDKTKIQISKEYIDSFIKNKPFIKNQWNNWNIVFNEDNDSIQVINMGNAREVYFE